MFAEIVIFKNPSLEVFQQEREFLEKEAKDFPGLCSFVAVTLGGIFLVGKESEKGFFLGTIEEILEEEKLKFLALQFTRVKRRINYYFLPPYPIREGYCLGYNYLGNFETFIMEEMLPRQKGEPVECYLARFYAFKPHIVKRLVSQATKLVVVKKEEIDILGPIDKEDERKIVL